MQYKMLFNLEIISQTSIGLLYVFWKKKEKKKFFKKTINLFLPPRSDW